MNNLELSDIDDNISWTFQNRIALFLISTLYPIWALLFSLFQFPGTTDSFLQRSLIGFCSALILALSFFSVHVKNQLMNLTTLACIATTAHYFYLVYINQMQQAYAIGAFVTVVSISSIIYSIRNLLIYAIATLCLSIFASSVVDTSFQAFFISGIATSLFVTAVSSNERFKQIRKLTAANKVISKQKSALAMSTKMSALGEMAGGIAHEINNPLAIISGLSAQIKKVLAKDKLNDEDKITLENKFDKIQITVERIAIIIRGLRSFSRDGQNDPIKEENIGDLIAESVSMCSEKLKYNGVELIIEPHVEFHFAQCRATQVSQVILNLLNNSSEAISGLTQKWIRVGWKKAEGMLQISITDSGHGISDAVLEKIFQPFYTTKPVGQGTGLGLSISKGLLEAMNGRLEYDKSSKQTRFLIYLPECRVSTESKINS